jgi:predicted  nucleic acid-binding Zn-ribbon protein
MVHAPESNTAVDDIEEIDNKVAALEREMEQERLRVEAHVKQLVELKAKKAKEAAE